MRAVDAEDLEIGQLVVVYSSGKFIISVVTKLNDDGSFVSNNGMDIYPNEDNQHIVIEHQ